MKKKLIGSIMAGFYVSLGASIYIALGHNVAGAIFFALGIISVSCYYNMLSTRVFTLMPFRHEKISDSSSPHTHVYLNRSKYGLSWVDIPISLGGNIIGCIIYSWLLSMTRFGSPERLANLQSVVELRLMDNYGSLFIFSILCGFFVASACLAHRIVDNKLTQLLLSVVFIAGFVLTVPEHIVADLYFFSYYSFTIGFEPAFIPILIVVTIGNIIGCMGTGYLERYRTQS
jgi:formate/nitrite transporter FocA (FNT family)